MFNRYGLAVCLVVLVVVLVGLVWLCVQQTDLNQQSWCASIMSAYATKDHAKTHSSTTNTTMLHQLVDPTNKPIHCFYINLDRSPDRNQHVVSQVSRLGWTCHRVQAVDGKQPGQLDIIAKNDFVGMSGAELGCVGSHLKAVRTAWLANLDYALIFEDDVSFDFVPHWPDNLVCNLLSRTAKNIGIVQLAWFDDQRHPSTKYLNEFVLTDVPHNVNCCSACAYIVTRKGMHDILSVASYPNTTNQTDQTDQTDQTGRFQLVKKYVHQKHGQADFYLYDLTMRCVTGLPLFMPDNRQLASMISKTGGPSGRCDIYFAQTLQNYGLVAETARPRPVLLDSRPSSTYRLETVVSGKLYDIKQHKLYYAHSLVGQYFSKALMPGRLDVLAKLVRNLQNYYPVFATPTVLVVLQPNDTAEMCQSLKAQLASLTADLVGSADVALMHVECTHCTVGAECQHVDMLLNSRKLVGIDAKLVACQPVDQLFVLACSAQHVVASDSQYARMVRQVAKLK